MLLAQAFRGQAAKSFPDGDGPESAFLLRGGAESRSSHERRKFLRSPAAREQVTDSSELFRDDRFVGERAGLEQVLSPQSTWSRGRVLREVL